MTGYNFTQRMRVVLALAREEAAALNHEYVGTEHLLLALLREGGRQDSSSDQGVAMTTLRNLGVDTGAIAARIHATVQRGKASRWTGPDLPYTSRAKVTLELAMKEARELNHSYVGTEHLLLGLVREEKGIAAQVLAVSGVRLEHARAEVRRLLGSPPASGERRGEVYLAAEALRGESSGELLPVHGGVWVEGHSGRRIDSVEISLRFHDGEVRRRSFATPREAAEFLWRGGAS